MRRVLIGTIIGLLVGFMAGSEWRPTFMREKTLVRRDFSGPTDLYGDQIVTIRGTWVKTTDKSSTVYPYVEPDRLPFETSEITCSKNELVCKEVIAGIGTDGVLRIRGEDSPITSWDSAAIVTEINGPIPMCVRIITRYDLRQQEAVQYLQRKSPKELSKLPTTVAEDCNSFPQTQEFILSGGNAF